VNGYWDALLSVAQSLLVARSGPGNGGIPIFEGNWLGTPLVVYAEPFAGQVTAVRIGAFDFLYEKIPSPASLSHFSHLNSYLHLFQ
jgi:hypothetical protein